VQPDDAFLRPTPVIDWDHPDVLALARRLGEGADGDASVARRCFEWVRDEIRHSQDHGLRVVTCRASDVLREGSGFCYAKSHLLAAVLRANGIPAGLCYQRLSLDDTGTAHCLHGLTALRLPGVDWYRVDARGNKPGVDAQFDPPNERLAFQLTLPGEADLPGVWPDPLPVVVRALESHISVAALGSHLPDLEPWRV
jgi:transglutaminase-like putative cysteine protease